MPNLNQRIDNLGWLIKAVGALIALLPGIAILLGLVNIPPDLHDLIQYISFGISVVTILVVMLLTQSIHRLGRGLAVLIIIACVIGGSISAIAYWDYASNHIVTLEGSNGPEIHIIPDHPSAELDALVKPYAYDYEEALETHVQRDRIAYLMAHESTRATAKIILYLVLAQTMTIAAIVFGAWKLTGSLRSTAKPRPA
jgi:hypothetical protein